MRNAGEYLRAPPYAVLPVTNVSEVGQDGITMANIRHGRLERQKRLVMAGARGITICSLSAQLIRGLSLYRQHAFA